MLIPRIIVELDGKGNVRDVWSDQPVTVLLASENPVHLDDPVDLDRKDFLPSGASFSWYATEIGCLHDLERVQRCYDMYDTAMDRLAEETERGCICED